MKLPKILIGQNKWFGNIDKEKRRDYFYYFASTFFVLWMVSKILLIDSTEPIVIDLFFLLLTFVFIVARFLVSKR